MTEPIILEKPITLYDASGNAVRSYHLELDGEVRKKQGKVLSGNATLFDNHFRGLGDGTSLLNLPEAYAAIEQMHEVKHSALDDFFKDIYSYCLILNTQFDYQREVTIHSFDDNDVLEIPGFIPEDEGKLAHLVQDQDWKNALQRILLCKDPVKAVDILSAASGKEPYIYTPSHDSRKRIPKRIAWFGCDDNLFDLYGNYNLYNSGAARGVRRSASVSEQEAPIGADTQKSSKEKILVPVTKELLLPIARPYISGYDWETFSGRIPDQAPALGDVMLAAHKDGFVCAHSTPEFDQQIRNLYFPPPPKKEEKK